MSKIENVARALFRVDYPEGGDPEETLWERRQEWYRAAARAAIEEMREPTEGMIQAAGGWDTSAFSDWTIMIKAALEGK